MRLLLPKKLAALTLSMLLVVILLLTALLIQLLTEADKNADQGKAIQAATPAQETKATLLTQTVLAQSTFTYDHAKFAAEGFPKPQDPNPVKLDPEAFQIWQSAVMPKVVDAASKVGIDAGFLGSWSFMEGINYNMWFDNCNDPAHRKGHLIDNDLNTNCPYDNWQVGHGIRPAENIQALEKAFTVMYGSADTATVQRVGQSVIDTLSQRHPGKKITYPGTTFPNVSIQQLKSGMGDPAMRTWAGHLMRDDAIYAYLQAVTMKWHWDRPQQLAAIMRDSWGSATHYAPQRVINYVKATYDGGVSGTPGTGTVGGGSLAPITLVLKPKEENSYVINMATARAIGGSGSGGNVGSGSGNLSPDGKHACPVKATFQPFTSYDAVGKDNMSWICEHCHDRNTFRSIDMGTYPGGGTPIVALVNGTASKMGPPASAAKSIVLEGDDGVLYFYTHLESWSIPDGETKVTVGQVIGTVARAGTEANNNVAHLHIQGTTNGSHFTPNVYMGPLLDTWCGVKVCNGTQTSCGFGPQP